MRIKILVAALLASGCGTVSMAGMSPEQLREMVKVKDANNGCIVFYTPYGRAMSVWLYTYKVINGRIDIKSDTFYTILEGLTKDKLWRVYLPIWYRRYPP